MLAAVLIFSILYGFILFFLACKCGGFGIMNTILIIHGIIFGAADCQQAHADEKEFGDYFHLVLIFLEDTLNSKDK